MIPLNSMTSVIAHGVIDFFDNRDFNNTYVLCLTMIPVIFLVIPVISRDTCDFS